MSTTRPRRTLFAAAAGVAVLAATLTALAAPTDAAGRAGAEVTQLRPAELPRGADVAGVHLEAGKHHDTLVDGDRSLAVPGRYSTYLGRSGAAYVVKTVAAGEIRTVRLRPDGTSRLLHRSQDSDNVVLTPAGDILVAGDLARRGTDVSLIDPVTGKRYDHRVFAGDRQVLDADPVHVVLGGFTHPTVIWRLDNMRRIRISDHHGYLADLAADRLATMTRDPYDGGCTVVTTIDAPRQELWRSCRQRVESFSPDGGLMTTVDSRTDGLGSTEVRLRTSDGSPVAVLRAAGWFGSTAWEDATTALLPTTGRTYAAVVRCAVNADDASVACERASELAPRQDP